MSIGLFTIKLLVFCGRNKYLLSKTQKKIITELLLILFELKFNVEQYQKSVKIRRGEKRYFHILQIVKEPIKGP